MSGIKQFIPELGMLGQQIAPAEIDRMEQYVVINPCYGTISVGTWPVAGTAALGTLVYVNAAADYPRNVVFRLTGTATGMAGTCTIYGYSQFGTQIETIGFGSADNGGTTVGTKVWSNIGTALLQFGTAVGNGTAGLSWGTAGTTTLWGLPFKIGSVADVKNIAFSSNHLSGTTVNGGTITSTYVDTTAHAIKGMFQVAGTAWTMSVLAKPTYSAEKDSVMVNVKQRA